MKDAILRKARESAGVKEQFFRAEADRIDPPDVTRIIGAVRTRFDYTMSRHRGDRPLPLRQTRRGRGTGQ